MSVCRFSSEMIVVIVLIFCCLLSIECMSRLLVSVMVRVSVSSMVLFRCC